MKEKLQGVVYIQFIVEKDGSIEETKILRSPHELFADIAVQDASAHPVVVHLLLSPLAFSEAPAAHLLPTRHELSRRFDLFFQSYHPPVAASNNAHLQSSRSPQ